MVNSGCKTRKQAFQQMHPSLSSRSGTIRREWVPDGMGWKKLSGAVISRRLCPTNSAKLTNDPSVVGIVQPIVHITGSY
jgi:hypothetical protein